jgi:glycine cleavage system H protein
MLERRYSRDHSWAERRDGALWVGLTAHAIERLGRLTQLQISAEPGQQLPAGGLFGSLESDKTVIELYTPVGGKVLAINEALLRTPGRLQEDCYQEGWLLRLQSGDAGEAGESGEFIGLLDASAYNLLLKTRAADL